MEVVVPAEVVGPRIAAVDELTPQQLFTLYADQQALAPEAAAIGCVTDTCTCVSAVLSCL